MKEAVKSFAQDYLGEYYVLFREIFNVVFPFISPFTRFYWLYIVTFLVVAFVLYARQEKGQINLMRMFQFVFPRSVYLHPSAILTTKFYFVNGILVTVLLFSLSVLTATEVAGVVSGGLQMVFGENPGAPVSLWGIALFSLLIVMTMDFANWFGHYVFHRIPFLWEFHKVHHCPEQLTPLTNEQQHPFEMIVRRLIGAFFGGLTIGFFNYAYLEPVQEFTVMKVGVIFLAFSLLANFRHSHIWLPFPIWLSRVLSSPAMHQVHHSKAPEHWDKNYAVIFSLWDWIFGTIYIPQKKETLRFGLAHDSAADYNSLVNLYWVPCKKAWYGLTGAKAEEQKSETV